MKTKLLTLAAALGLAIVQTASAANYTWTFNGTAFGGTGTWTTGSGNNWKLDGTGPATTWADGNSATFNGTAGTVTVSGTVGANRVDVKTTGYLFSGGMIDFGAGGIIDANNVTGVTWNATLAGALTYQATANTSTIASNNAGIFNGNNTGLTSFELALATDSNAVLIGNGGALGTTGTNFKLTKGVLMLGNLASDNLNMSAVTTELAGGTIRARFGNSTWTGATSLSATSQIMTRNAANVSLVFSEAATINLNSNTLNLMASSTSTGIILNGVISGAGNLATVSNGLGGSDNGSGTTKLTAANTFNGTTAINMGTISVSGANGTIKMSSGVTVGSGATLKLDNTTAANNGDRLGDTVGTTLNGGTLNFSNDGGAADFSETTGNLTIGAGPATVSASQAGASNNSTLTFASLSRTTGTLNFAGTGLGVDSRNRILFSTNPTLANGIIGGWATYNGAGFASYDVTNGVVAYTGYTDIDALGSTIADGSTTNVRINAAGSGGNIALGAATTTVNTLFQNTTTAATVDTAGKTLVTSTILIGSGQQSLTIGAAAGDGTLTVDSAGGTLNLLNSSSNALTINAGIADNSSASSLVTTGNVTLNGVNTYTGTTNIGASLTFGSNSDQTVAGNISGPGALTKSGGGNLTLAGSNSYSGNTTITAGRLKSGSATAFNGVNSLTMTGTGTLDLNGYNASFIGNVVTGSLTNTITDSAAGAGTSILTFSQTSGTTVNTAALITDGPTRKVGIVISNANGAQQFSNGNNTFSGGLTLVNSTFGSRMQIAAGPVFTGTPGALTSGTFGTGTITIGQASTDKAGIYISAANITLPNAVVANTGLGTDRVGTFRIDSTGNTFSGQLTAGASDFTLATNGTGSVNLTGNITGSNGLKLLSHSLGGSSLTVTLTNVGGTNDYGGNTTINDNPQSGRSYTLALGASDQIPNGSGKGNVVINTNGTGLGTLRLQGFSETINGLSGTGTVTTTVAGASVLTLGDNDSTASFSGNITNTTGTVGIVKIGAGSQTLSGPNTYTGSTTVSAGTLIVSGGGTLSTTSDITVLTGATLTNDTATALTPALALGEGSALSGTGNFNPTAMTLTGNLADGFTPVTAGSTLTKAGALTFTLSGVTDGTYSLFTGSPASSFTSVNVGGSPLTFDGGDNLWKGNVGGFDYAYSDIANTLTVAIPEPKTWALIGLGLGFTLFRMGARSRRLKRLSGRID